MLVLRCVRREDTPLRPPPVQVPEGCLADQSGEYVHAQNPTYRYRGRDDGGTLVLVLEEGPAADGGTRPAPAAAPRVVLRRTPAGFVGRTEAQAFTGGGQSCAVSFPTEITACQGNGLTLRSAASIQVNELCQGPAPAPGAPMLEHRLLRRAAAADGGPG
ncbi:MAG TPA: hypothetical protein VND93_25460 [Myxococcales bacterium]|nr:hypothetical protein [Myxococcales bacterium]